MYIHTPDYSEKLISYKMKQLMGTVLSAAPTLLFAVAQTTIYRIMCIYTFKCCITCLGYFEGEDGAGMKLAVFDTLSSVLQSSLRERGSAHGTKTQRLLHTLARATPEIVEVCV